MYEISIQLKNETTGLTEYLKAKTTQEDIDAFSGDKWKAIDLSASAIILAFKEAEELKKYGTGKTKEKESPESEPE